MAFFGKQYKLVKEENFEAFINAVVTSPEEAAVYLNYRPDVTFLKNGDEYVFVKQTGGDKKEVTFKSGVPFDNKVHDVACKTTYTVDGNTITQVEELDVGLVITSKREFSGDELVLTLTTNKWDGVARRYYKA